MKLTVGVRRVLCLELLQVQHVLFIQRRLLIRRKALVVLVLGRLSLRLERFFLRRRQVLPVLTNKFGNFCEGQVAALKVISHLCCKPTQVSRADTIGRQSNPRGMKVYHDKEEGQGLPTVGEEHICGRWPFGGIFVGLGGVNFSNLRHSQRPGVRAAYLGVSPVLALGHNTVGAISLVGNGRGRLLRIRPGLFDTRLCG